PRRDAGSDPRTDRRVRGARRRGVDRVVLLVAVRHQRSLDGGAVRRVGARAGSRVAMEFEEAALAVLRDEGRSLHWTGVQDLALKRGYLDPFTQRDIRRNLLAALASASRDGRVRKVEKGVYELV